MTELDDLLTDGRPAGAFALVCAEELAPVAELAPDPTLAESVRQALDLAGQLLAGAAVRDSATAVRDGLQARLGEDANFGRYHSQVDDTVSAACYALEAALHGDRRAARNAAGRVQEVYLAYAAGVWQLLTVEELARTPVVSGLLRRQRLFAGMVNRDEYFDTVLPNLVKQAAGNGRALVGRLTGKAEDGPDTEGDQESLF